MPVFSGFVLFLGPLSLVSFILGVCSTIGGFNYGNKVYKKSYGPNWEGKDHPFYSYNEWVYKLGYEQSHFQFKLPLCNDTKYVGSDYQIRSYISMYRERCDTLASRSYTYRHAFRTGIIQAIVAPIIGFASMGLGLLYTHPFLSKTMCLVYAVIHFLLAPFLVMALVSSGWSYTSFQQAISWPMFDSDDDIGSTVAFLGYILCLDFLYCFTSALVAAILCDIYPFHLIAPRKKKGQPEAKPKPEKEAEKAEEVAGDDEDKKAPSIEKSNETVKPAAPKAEPPKSNELDKKPAPKAATPKPAASKAKPAKK